ncbi:Chromodomain-helicase-DNA-binding protein 7, partial [Pseudolycoriella hygida]
MEDDAYYRYDAAAPRPMGPPGAYARHRAPHPLQQQQPQYPSYQSPADNMYSMGDQHGGLGGLSDLGGWGTPANAQAGPYPAPGMTYGHPQASPQSQRQSQSQTGYRQHISPYPQQDPQKMQFPGQQGLMLQQQGYGALSQQQAQQQRVPQHYSQATTHPMYAGAPQAQPTSQSQYASYASTAAMQHQSSRPPQHVAYGHSQLDQPSYQHLSNSAAPNLHLPSAQTQPQQHSNHPVQQNQGHLGQSQQSHISHPVQPQSQIHSSQVVHPPQQQAHPQNHSQHPGLVPHSNVQQSASNIPTSQQQSHTNLGHPQSQHPQQQQTQHQNLMHPVGPVTAQHQPPLVSQQQNQTVHPIGQQLGLQMPHNHPAYGVPHPSQAGPQQTPYITPSKPQSQQQSQAQQMGSSPQYRAPFPQLSPQMSPRPPQMSPHSQMSPRQVMSPAKPLQQTPLSPHPHMPGGPSPRPSQQSGMPSQQTSKGSSSSVSTLQALEQMVMPPSNNNSGNNIEYPPSPYRPPLHQQHQSSSNPLSPMGPRMPMSPQHQQWPPINRPTSGLGNTNLNHQQQQQQQHMYAQLPSMSQINELTPLSMPPTSRSLSPFNIAELDSKKPSEYSMMQQPSEPALSIQNLVNQDTPVSSADVNLLDPFSAVMEPIAPTVTPVPIEKTHTENTHQIQQQMLHQSQLHRQDMSPIPQQPSSLQHQQPMLNDQQQLQQHNSSSHLQSHSQLHQPKIQTPSQQQQLQQIAEPHHTLHSSSNEDSSIMQSLNDNSNSNMSMPAQSLDAMKLSESDSTNENSNHPQENINEESMSSLRGNDEQSQDGLSAETIKNITDTLRSPETSPPPVEPEVEPQPTELTQSESDTLVLEPQIESVQSPAPDESSETNQVAKSPLIETPIVPTVESAAVEEIPPIVESTSQPEPTPTVQPQLTNVQTHPIAVTSAPPSVMQNSLLQQSIPMSIIPGQTMYDPIMMGVRPPTAAAGMHTMIQHPGMVYPPAPINHHAERAALQQQLQEMYCMPPNQEIQEKIVRLQERLNLLSQHEANDQCSGGSQCILQSPLYTAPMIDSPQVSSTTGRGRGRGSTKPRKPRIKKAEKLLLQQQQQQQQQQISQISADSAETLPGKNPELLPVSEDCVTPGAGLAGLTDISNEMTELNEGDDQSQDRSFADLDATTTDGRKTKKPRKPRTPKDPNKIKEPKVPKEPKEPKERKKREPRDPNEPKKKRGRKPNAEKQLLDQSGDQSMSLDTSNELNRTDDASSPIPTNQSDDGKSNDGNNQMVSDEVTDFDDIPVSKIPIKSLLEDAAKKAELDGENSQSSIPEDGSTPKRNRKSTGGPRPGSGRKRGSTKSGKKKLRHRGRIVPESDGEADDLITTPPPSPPIDPEFDSLKRRSARNTQRKKYVDDVMLSISDEESGIISPTPVKAPKEKKEDSEKKDIDGVEEVEKVDEGEEVSTTENVENSEKKEKVEKLEKKSDKVEKLPDTDNNKPNYVYVNTTDEDSMVVQHVLAMRMGKRELLPEPKQKKRKQKKADEKVVKDEVENKDYEDNVDKSNKEIGHGKSDGKDDGSNVSKEKHTEDDKEQISDHDSAEHLSLEAEEVAVPKKREGKEEMTSETQKMDVDDEEMKTDLSSPKDTALSPDEKSGNEETKENKQKEEKAEVSDAKAETDASSNKSDTESESSSDSEDEKDKPPPVMVDVEEYYVKYRNFSYLHCEWRTEEELFKGDRRVAAKIKRFQMKQAQQMNIFENLDEDPFNPDFVETDRVLDVSEHTDSQTGEKATHYLVKWKSLPYEDSTWELEKDVDSVKIEQFQQFSKIPPKDKWKPKRRPTADQWKQLSETPVYKGNNTLRPYQLEGLNWLKFSWYNSHNCILADEMGLGKTIQSLTFVHSCFEYGIRGPFLVIAPLSTIPNWQREFESWTDLNVVVYHGSVTSKQMISEYEFYYKNENGKIIKDLNKFNVLITTFEMIVTDYADLRLFNWRVCVIDEAHRLKNRNCKLLEGLRQLNLEHRVLLSGTPLQNNVNELFSLLNFLEPTQFASCDAFLKEFGSLKTESEVQKLQALLKPMMLRRLKDDVEKSLAPKTETIVEVELTNIQKKYYRGILEQNFSFLKKGTTAQNIPNLMNTMMELRKCCIHPYLLNGAEDQIQYDSRHTHGEDPDSYYKNLILSAGKMVLIDKLLPKLRSNGHRVLIFSQMVRCLDILEDYLIYRKYPFERIDGRIRGNLRQAAIDRYSKPDSDRFVFLLCTKAGGLGINLTAADTVIIYDSDWNPQNDLQAQARCHRIGQQKMVKIYRLLCRNTYEREMFDKASLKLGLDKAILQSMNTGLNSSGKETGTRQLSKKEIEDLLKKGAYGAVMDDDNAGDKFCEEDIDSILERRTQVITMEYEKGSTFSKASFAASGNRSDITIDDPDFWTKWAKKAEINENAGEPEQEDLIIAEPRRRTQIKRYGHDEGVMDMSEESAQSAQSDEEEGMGLRSKRKRDKFKKGKPGNDDYIPRDRDTLAALGMEDVTYGSWARSECFKVEKGLLSYGWGRWNEINEQGQFKRGWALSDIEDCARIILLYCLQVYRGDEKIKNFIWDLITPTESGEENKISRNHSGLHNLVPRGRNAKGGKGPKENPVPKEKIPGAQNILDPNHWSRDEKYNAEEFLEPPYKKHLGRHANKVLLRVRMLYYIKHEVIGDLVQQITDGASASELPICPPPTNDQMPSSWWIPKCCDKSLLVGTYKHGCENYRPIRCDPALCFVTHLGPGDDASFMPTNEDDGNSKHETEEDVDDDGTATKDSDSKATDSKDTEFDRPSSSGIDDDESVYNAGATTSSAVDDQIWPSMQDLNTRLRRVITSYQRNYKKEELKQQQKAKLQAMVNTQSIPPNLQSATTSAQNANTNLSQAMAAAHQQQQQQQAQQQNVQQSQQSQLQQSGQQSQQGNSSQSQHLPTAADIQLMISLGLGLNPSDASQLANWDLQKLAMLLKMERRDKIDQAVKERERVRLDAVQKKWSRRDESEFLRVLTGYGVDLQQCTNVPTPDWMRFKAMAKLDKKSDESLSDYYK